MQNLVQNSEEAFIKITIKLNLYSNKKERIWIVSISLVALDGMKKEYFFSIVFFTDHIQVEFSGESEIALGNEIS